MIVKDEFLNKLRRYFSLNLYEVKVWTALLSRGVSTAGELSDIANVPRSRSYDVLETLEKKGFVIMKIGKPIKYMAVSPNEVLERVKKNLKAQTAEKIDRLSNLKNSDVLNELNNLHEQGINLVEPSELTASLKGRQNLYDHLELTLKGAEKEVIIMSTSTGLIRKLDFLSPVLKSLKKRGVTIKIAAPIKDIDVDVLKDLSDVIELRYTKTNARFVVVDGKEMVFMLMDDAEVHSSYDLGIWINTPFFASAMTELFNLAWKGFKPLSLKK